jgi:hypothetical protein
VFPEYFVNYKGNRLFFDFFIKELNLFFECQGRQHSEFVKHFHGTKEKFVSQKFRDNLKIEYVQENGMYLVRVQEYEKIIKELILKKIDKAFESAYHYCD